MIINIDEQKILSEILERDGSLHQAIKERVRENLITKITEDIESEYMEDTWRGRTTDISDRVTRDLEEKQTTLVKKILEEFYDSYRYKKTDLAILKKLKEFIGKI